MALVLAGVSLGADNVSKQTKFEGGAGGGGTTVGVNVSTQDLAVADDATISDDLSVLGDLGVSGTLSLVTLDVNGNGQIDSDGDVCVQKGAPLELQRSAPGRPISVAVVNLQTKARASTEFGVGSATTAWPQAVGVEVGRYSVVLPSGEKREIRLRPIDPLPAADDTIRLLHSQRCLKQVEAWLRGQSIAGR